MSSTTSTTSTPSSRAPAAPPGPPASPQASRLGAPRWLDLRLVLGVLLVLGSVVVGARVLASADDTVPVLVATEDLTPDRPLTDGLVQARQVRLEEGLELYLSGDVPDGYVVVQPVRSGELVPRSAVAPAQRRADALRYVTVALPAAELPARLRPGRVVDVWVLPATGGEDGPGSAEELLTGVTVADVTGDAGGLGVTGTERPVTLAVTAESGRGGLEEDVARLVAAAREARIYLTAVPEDQGSG